MTFTKLKDTDKVKLFARDTGTGRYFAGWKNISWGRRVPVLTEDIRCAVEAAYVDGLDVEVERWLVEE